MDGASAPTQPIDGAGTRTAQAPPPNPSQPPSLHFLCVKDLAMRVTRRLRELLAGPDLVVAPGAYDGLSARLIAQAGFSLIYMTGFGTAASVLGQPDVGLLTMNEMVGRASALATVLGDLPLIADADTGYGNPINVRRTIHEYKRAGAKDTRCCRCAARPRLRDHCTHRC